MNTLPTVPTAVAQLSALLNDENAGAAEFETVVRPDPALTANVLKLANSAYFGVRRQISSVRHAIALLGTDRVFELAATGWLIQSLPRRIPGYDVSAKSLWLHSLAVGVFNEQLAIAGHIRPPDMAFTAGLLHDVGKLVLGTIMAEEIDAIFEMLHSHGKTFVDAERDALGMDHGEVGAILCEKWRLPKPLEWAARWHHAPNQTPPGADQVLVDLTHLADSLAHALGLGADIGELSRRVDEEVLDRLILDRSEIDRAISNSVMNQIWEMGDMVSGGITC